jgi:hypothetical protein
VGICLRNLIGLVVYRYRSGKSKVESDLFVYTFTSSYYSLP